MEFAVLNMSKYVFALVIILYTVNALCGYATRSGERQIRICVFQRVLIIVFHFCGFMVLFLQNELDYRYVILFVLEALYFVSVYFVFTVVYKQVSHLLVCNMCMLMSVGFIMITRLNYSKGVKQFAIACVATLLAIFIPMMLKRMRFIRSLGWIYCIAGLVLLTALLFCSRVFGANLVLTVGPVSVQPSEFVKLLFVMFVASMFNKKMTFGSIVKVSVLAFMHILILVICKDLGAALIFFTVYVIMLYVATRKTGYLVLGAVAAAGAGAGAYMLFDHVKNRVDIWIDPWSLIDNQGYQICQSLFAIGMGSWFGYGLGQGLPEMIPVAEKDFMFSVIAEEMGVIFCVCLLVICLNNFMLMMYIASRCRTLFYRLLAVGIGVTYGFQIFLTVGGAMKLIPMTGVTLPFVSYGGSSIMSSIISFVIILGIYNLRQDDEDDEPQKKKKTKKKVQQVYT